MSDEIEHSVEGADDGASLQAIAQRLRQHTPTAKPRSQPAPLPSDGDILLQQICEGALLAAGKALSIEQLQLLFENQKPEKSDIKRALLALQRNCEQRGVELVELSLGWRLQVRANLSPWVSRLWQEKPQKYSRALLETLALIAYRQPITRGEIEDIRGVAVSSTIMRTLIERNWVRTVGHKDVPGRPTLYATSKGFLDYFNLPGLESLPSLAQLQDLHDARQELDLSVPLAAAPLAELNAIDDDKTLTSTSDQEVEVSSREATKLADETAYDPHDEIDTELAQD